MELLGSGVRIVLEHVDEDTDEGSPAGLFVEVSNEDEGQASLLLGREDVEQVHDFLHQWLAQDSGDI
jgi:hypothetical protein